jgi:hypothetical protein
MGQRFLRVHLIKLSRLMDMLYKPSEIAAEIGVTVDTVYRSYLPGGCPFERDKKDDIWIHGLAFAAWVRSVKESRKGAGLEAGQAFCLACRRAVPMLRPRERFRGRYVVIFQGKCETCGKKVNRAYAASAMPEGASA